VIIMINMNDNLVFLLYLKISTSDYHD